LIVTVTINPAIDRTLNVDRLVFEDRAYINSTHEAAGGRGINSSLVVHSFGEQTLAVLTSGGEPGKRLEELLAHQGLPLAVVPIAGDTRTNFTVTDRHGLTVNLNEVGPEVSKAEVAAVERTVRKALDRASWLLVCGSIPPGVHAEFYAQLIALARKKQVRSLLHCDGAALREGIEAKPTVVTPNQQEAERLLGRTLLTRTHYIEAAERIRHMGAESVALLLGSRGAVGAYADRVIEALPPRVDALCPIGAGDAMCAAYCLTLDRKDDPADALRWGVAAGTASARLAGMQFAGPDETREMYESVEIRRVD